jgi:hypothetical protein
MIVETDGIGYSVKIHLNAKDVLRLQEKLNFLCAEALKEDQSVSATIRCDESSDFDVLEILVNFKK